MQSLKLVFAGTPDFAVPSLQALIDSPHQVCAVFTQPDRPKGRGRKLTASPVKALANSYSIPVYQPQKLGNAELDTLRQLQVDLMVVIAYGLILPKAMLTLPRFGCINVHASLLPRWRGAAPIQRAIAAGDQKTGITIMQMDAGLDTGDILLQQPCTITTDQTSITLQQKLAVIGHEALLDSLSLLTSNQLKPTPQDNSQACYANKLTKNEARIDWQQDATVIAAKIRALQPWPGASTELAGMQLKLWQATAHAAVAKQPAGTLVALHANAFDIACGNGILQISQVQCPNRRAVTAGDFINAHQHLLIPHHTCFA